MYKILLKKKKSDWLLCKVLDLCPEFQNFPKNVRLVIRVNMVIISYFPNISFGKWEQRMFLMGRQNVVVVDGIP